ncbi:fibrinolytic enzyme, isozyme C-like [Littorina saxatilis]|uniref:Peptidase S1 domain-containing protein n=1 Tax=Littorina saxatilis TaxID=31220 RepID=A0AAN9GBN0_9CAEN
MPSYVYVYDSVSMSMPMSSSMSTSTSHCVDFGETDVSRFSVVCGAHDILDKLDSNAQTAVAAEITKHTDYDANANGFPNDIALIRLATPLTLNSRCQAANLPASNSKDYANKNSYITGWGRKVGGGPVATLLKQAAINTLSHSDCRIRWGIFFSPIRTTHICVFDASGYHGSCNGDSGGPLYSPDTDTGLLTVTGLTSFGSSGCDTAYPSVYTRVSSYLSWIAANSS